MQYGIAERGCHSDVQSNRFASVPTHDYMSAALVWSCTVPCETMALLPPSYSDERGNRDQQMHNAGSCDRQPHLPHARRSQHGDQVGPEHNYVVCITLD